MRRFKALGLVGMVLMASSLTLRADVWDLGTLTDNTIAGTRNHLIHGTDQVHDLAALGTPAVADLDYFLLRNRPFSSYSILVDGITSNNNLGANSVTRVDGSDALLQGIGGPIAGGVSMRMSWQNTTASTETNYIRVDSVREACGTACTANEQYRIRFYDTTISVPRFNNANGQVTVLLVQNATVDTVSATGYFWNAAGTQLHSAAIPLAPNQTAVINLAGIPALQNQSGAITLSHNTESGGLAVKSVALEPATGFSFDSPGLYKP